jgi:hypothetical protein
MAKRQALPDVLGDLLAEKRISKRTPEQEPEHHNTSVEEQHMSGDTEHQHRSVTAPHTLHHDDHESVSSEDAEVGKTKATFYLSREITQALEDTWLHLRRHAGKGRPTSKSVLVEAALRMTLPKLMENGVESRKRSTTAYHYTSTP